MRPCVKLSVESKTRMSPSQDASKRLHVDLLTAICLLIWLQRSAIGKAQCFIPALLKISNRNDAAKGTRRASATLTQAAPAEKSFLRDQSRGTTGFFKVPYVIYIIDRGRLHVHRQRKLFPNQQVPRKAHRSLSLCVRLVTIARFLKAFLGYSLAVSTPDYLDLSEQVLNGSSRRAWKCRTRRNRSRRCNPVAHKQQGRKLVPVLTPLRHLHGHVRQSTLINFHMRIHTCRIH